MADFIARIKPKKSSVAGEAPQAADLEVAEIAVNTADGKLFVKHTDGSIKEISGSGGSGGASDGSVRTSDPQVTTASLATGAYEDVTFTQTGRAGQFLKIEASCASWIVFYSSQAARTADATRASDENPAQGIGVLMEVFTDQAETVLITPSVLYFNDDANEGAEIYAKIVNRDPATQAVTVTATVVPIEGRALYEAEGTSRIKGLNVQTSSLATNASEFVTLGQTARSGQFTKIATSAAARVIFYSTKAARTADSSRQEGQTPLASSGVLMEVITAGAETLEVTPAILYQNSEPNAAGELYMSVTNLETTATAITVSVDVVPIEGRGAYLSELHELLDVDTTGVVDGDGIVYDAAASKWVPGASSSFSGSYNDLTDKPTLVTSINGLTDVDTSTVAPTDGQALVWDNANSQWEPGTISGGSNRIQDASDFELNTATNAVTLSPRKDPGGSDFTETDGWNTTSDFLVFSKNYAYRSEFLTLQVGDAVTFTFDGGTPHSTTVQSVLGSNSTNTDYIQVIGSFPSEASTATSVEVSSPSFVGGAPVPLAEGDILQWNDADQKFKPAQLPAGVEEAPEDGTPYARQDATWVSVSSGGGGSTVSDLADLDDVETSAPAVGEVVYSDNGTYRHASISELVAGRATSTGTITSTMTADTNMAGINGFYADDAALIADGFTHVTAGNNLDDGAKDIADIADWGEYSTVNYLALGFTSLPEIRINSNGSIYLHTSSATITRRTGDYASDHSTVSLCVCWLSQDSEVRRMGWKKITQDGTDWFVVRVDMKVPYNNETGGYPLETWFGKDGRIRQYWGDKIGSGTSITVGNTRQGVSNFSTNLTNVVLPFGAGGQRVEYEAAGALVGFAGTKLEDLSDVGTPTDGEALTYDAATTSWTTTAIPASPVDANNHTLPQLFGIGAHVSFDASAGGSFDFATDTIASGNVSGITRTATGAFTITFTNAFASNAYTAVCTAGDEDYSGSGASPRCVNVVSRSAGSMDIVVERSDDAVQDDEGYIAVMVIGLLA